MGGCGMGRRLWLGGALGCLSLARPAGAVLPRDGYRFRVLRDGRAVGTHTVGAEPDGIVRTVLSLEVKLLSFTVFRMRHEYAERWQDDRLLSFAAHTIREGRETRLDLAATPQGLRGRGPGGEILLPPAALPLSWWEPAHLRQPLFDTATGEALQGGPSPQRDQGGTRWLWPERGAAAYYNANGRWVGFTMRGDDGIPVQYEPAG
ncbi:DUF6134 family protein [Pseudoroseomonas globiformis]|uniref:DUF6134 family protein n=1 Tax=Teichococcus globiformis TaxID=2307229 RepID=A0ABV7G2T9_9PROT